MLEESFYEGKAATERSSPATRPDDVKPALFGTYSVKLARHGIEVKVKPAFQVLADLVDPWDYEHTASVTGLDAEQIKRTAEMIGTMNPVEFFQGTQYQSTNTSQYLNAATILKIMKGQVDNPDPGATVMTQFYPVSPMLFPSEFDISFADGLPLEQKRKRLGLLRAPHRLWLHVRRLVKVASRASYQF